MSLHVIHGRKSITFVNLSSQGPICIRMDAQHFDPWATADALGIRITRTLISGARGYTDGCHRIWVDSRLTRPEARVTLTHEIVHIAHGHAGHQPQQVEEMVRRVTARWLVPWWFLLEQWGPQGDLAEIADRLDVTVHCIRDRVAYATNAEALQLKERASCAWLAA